MSKSTDWNYPKEIVKGQSEHQIMYQKNTKLLAPDQLLKIAKDVRSLPVMTSEGFHRDGISFVEIKIYYPSDLALGPDLEVFTKLRQ